RSQHARLREPCGWTVRRPASRGSAPARSMYSFQVCHLRAEAGFAFTLEYTRERTGAPPNFERGVRPLCAINKMIIADLAETEGRRYPARRRTQNLAGGASLIQARNFCVGNVTLEPNGGQVPWHNHEQEEMYFILEGAAEMCLGEERSTLSSGQAVYIPSS